MGRVRDGGRVRAEIGLRPDPLHVDVAGSLDPEAEEGDRRDEVVVELVRRAGVQAPVREVAVDLVAEEALDVVPGLDPGIGGGSGSGADRGERDRGDEGGEEDPRTAVRVTGRRHPLPFNTDRASLAHRAIGPCRRGTRLVQDRTFVLFFTVPMAYAELHCHSNFSFLDGASAPDELVERAIELGLAGLAVTDHQGLYGAVRFASAAEAAGIHPVIGVEVELLDAIVPDPAGVVGPARRPRRRPSRGVGACSGSRGRRGRAGSAPAGTGPAARPSRRGQGGSPRHRRPAARRPPRPARRERRRLAEPVPADLAGEPRRDEGRAAVPRGLARRARRRGRGAHGLPRGGDRPAAAGRRPGGGAGCGGGARGAVPGPRSTSSCRTTCCRTTTGSSPSPSRWPASCDCRSSSRTTSTTPGRRVVSSRTS